MTDFNKTRDQLIERALKMIGALQPGEAAAAEDAETVDELIDPLIAQLAADRIIVIQDLDAIELEVFMPLASLLANAAGPDFGSPFNDEAKARDEATLRRINSTDPTYETMTGSYY